MVPTVCPYCASEIPDNPDQQEHIRRQMETEYEHYRQQGEAPCVDLRIGFLGDAIRTLRTLLHTAGIRHYHDDDYDSNNPNVRDLAGRQSRIWERMRHLEKRIEALEPKD